jgi:hypothetical protein
MISTADEGGGKLDERGFSVKRNGDFGRGGGLGDGGLGRGGLGDGGLGGGGLGVAA